ncbi:MAG: MFS transporter [Candidatus Thermoplasmatota archaeon]|jgi:MFS family permease|nr:MFS transporter [Candidatus Thermoplasmatota archaeon]MCL5800918.1 MFS transporter [Candidatus Thermoplasmatota archaeon]
MNRTSGRRATVAIAFSTFIAFMGIGVVDPLLPLIGKQMGASPFQVEWLFTSYIAVMSLSMFISGYFSTKFGSKKTLTTGLLVVILFSALSGLSPNIELFAIFRGGWGLGNAFFTSTALSIIVGVSAGKLENSISIYEAALGLGIASGPLLGGFLGSFSWRYPFFGTTTLMAIGFIASMLYVIEPKAREKPRTPIDIINALRSKPVRMNSLIALGYNFGFFTILAFTPLTLFGLTTEQLGITYFLWGMLVAFSSVILVPRLVRRISRLKLLQVNLLLFALIFIFMGSFPYYRLELIVVSGIFCGISNASFTSLAMEVSPFSRSVSSAAYNFLRWAGAAIAPILDGLIAQTYGFSFPFFVTAPIVIASFVAMFMYTPLLRNSIDAGLHDTPLATST